MVLSGNVDLTGPATNGHRVPSDNASAKQQLTELVLNLFLNRATNWTRPVFWVEAGFGDNVYRCVGHPSLDGQFA